MRSQEPNHPGRRRRRRDDVELRLRPRRVRIDDDYDGDLVAVLFVLLIPAAADVAACSRRRHRTRRRCHRRISKDGVDGEDSEPKVEAEEVWSGALWEAAWPRQARPVVLAGEEGSPDGMGSRAGEGSVGRARSLTDDDLEELKGCVDLGFGFSYNEIPELCGTLPALELCYSMSQRFLDEHQSTAKARGGGPGAPSCCASFAGPQLEDLQPWGQPR